MIDKRTIRLMLGDCLERMREIKSGSVDMVLCDLPYGTTACKWDSVIPFEPLWAEYRRLIRGNGAIVLFASQPFSGALVMSNAEWFKYAWVWEKSLATGHVHAKNKPLKRHEDILVFSPGTTVHASQSRTRMTYNPQGLQPSGSRRFRPSGGGGGSSVCTANRPSHQNEWTQESTGYPGSIIRFPNPNNKRLHPTQKPVALLEYLIKTYTNEGDTVLDNTMGSGSTGVAAINTNRHFIGIERDPQYFAIAEKRISSAADKRTMTDGTDEKVGA